MNRIFLLVLIVIFSPAIAARGQDQSHVPSASTRWNPLVLASDVTRAERNLVSGQTTHLAQLEVSVAALRPRAEFVLKPEDAQREQMLIVKSGQVTSQLGEEEHVLSPGSVILVMPGDPLAISNSGKTTAEFFRMSYRSKSPVDIDRGKRAGGSIVVDFKKLKFEPHDRGGLHDYFDRPTAMCENFEMHVTTLNAGIQSHEPHTHPAEEIILMVAGGAQEYINGTTHPIKTGDVAFLDSEIPHAIRNTTEKQCIYFAFQWE